MPDSQGQRSLTRRTCVAAIGASWLGTPTYGQQVQPHLISETRPILSTSFDRSGRLVTSSEANKVTLWNIRSPRERKDVWAAEVWKEFDIDAFVRVVFTMDGSFAISATRVGRTIQVWRIATGEIVTTLKVPSGLANTLAISDDSKYLAASGFCPRLYIWRLQTKEPSPFADYPLPEGRILALAYAGKGVLFMVTETGSFGTLDLLGDNKLSFGTQGGSRLFKAAVAQDNVGRIALMSATEGTLWDLRERSVIRRVEMRRPLESAPLVDIAVSGEGRALCIGAERSIVVSSYATGLEGESELSTKGLVRSLALDKTGEVAVASTDARELVLLPLRR